LTDREWEIIEPLLPRKKKTNPGKWTKREIFERWNYGNNNALARRMNLKRVGMSGHSFGAVTTQAVSGQRFGRGKARFRDPRVEAGDADVESRLAVFPALPPVEKYELVLEGAEHLAFTDRTFPGQSISRNPNHHPAILAITTAFWDATLKDDQSAKAWLNSEAVRDVLEKADRWQTK
jgi:predicted dienelactone hydrolase